MSVNDSVPDKPTSLEESADDIKALGEMQEAMARKLTPSVVQTLACRACDDIQQTVVRYAEEYKQ